MSTVEDKLYQLISEQRLISQAIEAVYGEILLLQRAIDERKAAISFLTAYEKIKDDSIDTLIPIGGGLYVKTNLPIKREFYIHVGANIYLIKSVEEAREHLEKMVSDLERALSERNKALTDLKNKYEEISVEISELYMRIQGKR
ncbi:MAG TPA: prefoldin subunit alpha [Thermoprotei archaeon]|nr:prefoldin subunit alpha [Thermoprotei archaeon]